MLDREAQTNTTTPEQALSQSDLFCKLCEHDDCPCPNDDDMHCATCKHLVGYDGYCGHCVALGDGEPYQHNKTEL